jgi:hypothetical protein
LPTGDFRKVVTKVMAASKQVTRKGDLVKTGP